MSDPDHVPATVLELASDGVNVRLQLAPVGGDLIVVTVAVPERGAHALAHIHALHGHSAGCHGRVDVHVDLLLRCCRVLGSGAQRLIVRATDAPAFWLQVQTAAGDLAHVDIGILDALVLLASRRVPVVVEAATMRPQVVADAGHGQDWDEALRELLEG